MKSFLLSLVLATASVAQAENPDASPWYEWITMHQNMTIKASFPAEPQIKAQGLKLRAATNNPPYVLTVEPSLKKDKNMSTAEVNQRLIDVSMAGLEAAAACKPTLVSVHECQKDGRVVLDLVFKVQLNDGQPDILAMDRFVYDDQWLFQMITLSHPDAPADHERFVMSFRIQ